MQADLDALVEKLPGAHRYERYVACTCPFHQDRKPSLLVYPDGFHCTACGAHGSIDKLLRQFDLRPTSPGDDGHSYYPDIWGKDKAWLVRSAHKELMTHAGYQHYLTTRGIGKVAIRKLSLGYYDGWYVIPVYHPVGGYSEFVASTYAEPELQSSSLSTSLSHVLFRAGPWVQQNSSDRFYQYAGQSPYFYAPLLELLLRSSRKRGQVRHEILFVVFGLFDAISLAILGYPVVTPTTGKRAFRAEWLDWWTGRIVVLPDQGEEREANRLAAALDWRGSVHLLRYPDGCKDPNDYLCAGRKDDLVGELDELVERFSNRRRSGTERARYASRS